MAPQYGFYEFFAGGGMARLGLGDSWTCLFANEWAEKKAACYRARFGTEPSLTVPELAVGDVAALSIRDLPGIPHLVWASFPCQDLSLAGNGAGLDGQRSGTFRAFWRLMEGLVETGRAPGVIVLENVVGAITSHKGKDFREIAQGISEAGYRVGALVLDAAHFVPQSRPRLFFVASLGGTDQLSRFHSGVPREFLHPESLVAAVDALPTRVRADWRWWNLPMPKARHVRLEDLIDAEPVGVEWHSALETDRLLALMSPLNRGKVENAQRMRQRIIGTVYRRTRIGDDGLRVQRAEVRFDGIAGCLRTPGGGSSRQIILSVDEGMVRSRLISPVEAARLMGVPSDYPIPANYNDAYHLFGDGLVVPVVRYLESHLLRPLVSGDDAAAMAA